MIFQESITNEEVTQLPSICFGGEIVVIDNISLVAEACEALGKEEIIGFDTETKPSFKVGVVNKVSLLQLSTESRCYLFRLSKIKLPKEIVAILANDRIVKVGVDIKNDIHTLKTLAKFTPKGFIELQSLVGRYNISELSLRKMVAILLGGRISKAQRLSNWDALSLTPAQQLYAATDAWASLRVYKELLAAPLPKGRKMVDYIGVPVFYGSDIKGEELAPNLLRESGVIDILSQNHSVTDMGDIEVDKVDEADKFKDSKNSKYLGAIARMNRQLFETCAESIQRGHIPITVGGDHSLCVGSIAAAATKGEVAVIWIDAHSDINTPNSSITKSVHGMGMSALLGMGEECLTTIGGKGAKIKPENIFMFAVRDVDPLEREILESQSIKVYTPEDIDTLGVKKVIGEVQYKLNSNRVKRVHLSFDVDSVRANLAPGVSVPAKGGITSRQALELVGYCLKRMAVKSIDVVEFNPLKDKNEKTLRFTLDMFKTISKELK